jgi:hypothetical protein
VNSDPINTIICRIALLTALLAAPTGCGSDTGTGNLAITAYGEDFIESGIPAAELSDGWAIAYDTFDVTLADISIGRVTLAGPVTVDLTKASNGKGQTLTTQSAPADDYTGGAYSVTRVHVAATATKGDVTKSFDWTIERTTRYTKCDAVVTVPKDGTGAFQVTIHADHLLYDSVVAEDPGLGFGAYAAADTNDDGVISKAEVEAAGIGAFDPGNEPLTTLWQFVEALSRTLGHANGEGHCEPQ